MLYTGIEPVITGLRIRRIASNAYRAYGTGDWTRTSTSRTREILSLLRLPLRHARTLHFYLTGGSGEIRTLEYPFEAFPTFEIGAFNLALPRFHKLVPRKGLEPSRTFVQRPLKTPWLPLHHLGKISSTFRSRDSVLCLHSSLHLPEHITQELSRSVWLASYITVGCYSLTRSWRLS